MDKRSPAQAGPNFLLVTVRRRAARVPVMKLAAPPVMLRSMVRNALPELEELERILEAGAGALEVRTACQVQGPSGELPVPVVCLGSKATDAPAVAFIGGVHGLERIGTQVVLSFLGSLVARLHWDESLHRQLEGLRLVFMPIVNPAGMTRRTRCNGNGVDLMRNAPIESTEGVPFLAGGQRLSRRIPWYRGRRDAGMEAESEALCRTVHEELLTRPFTLALDCHSGFGMRDRIWFPHANTRSPFERLAETHALVRRFDSVHPHHPYVFEPQSRQYLTHGDLWDYLCADPAARARIFVPLTLELGSWRWIRKSPRQLLSRLGIFNPMPADRRERVRRNHLLWMAFLCRAAQTWREWLPEGERRREHEREARALWFGP